MPMLVPVETLLDGVMETLRREVLPNLSLPRARGQLHAVLDILNNLRDRIEPRRASASEEAESAENALQSCVQVLRDARGMAAAEHIEALLAGALQATDDLERTAALRAAVTSAITLAATLPATARSPATAVLDQHLLAQTFRDLAGLKLSPLAEISKG